LRTIIEASPTLMPYLRQQRAQRRQPTDLRNPQNFHVYLRDEEFQDAAKRAHIAPAGRGKAIGGFYDRPTDAIHLPRDSKFGHALHEAIHKYSPTTQCVTQLDRNTQMRTPSTVTLCNCDAFLNEGLTQCFADIVLADQGLPKFTDHAYKDQLACAARFVRTYQLENVARLYFLNDSGGALNQFVQSKQCAHFCSPEQTAMNDGNGAARNEADIVPAISPTTSNTGPRLQRKCSCGGSCDQCRAKQSNDEHDAVRRKPSDASSSSRGSSGSETGMIAPPIVDHVLRSPGQPLDSGALRFFEARFGQRLNHVRVHANAQAAESASIIGARPTP
jgi:Domain of unknown function (DUF4157)